MRQVEGTMKSKSKNKLSSKAVGRTHGRRNVKLFVFISKNTLSSSALETVKLSFEFSCLPFP